MTEKGRTRVSRLAQEAMAGVTQKSSRSVLTIVGIALGIGSFIAVLGVTSSANGQISAEFTSVTSTQISVQPSSVEGSGITDFPDTAEASVQALTGVSSAAVSWDVSADSVRSLFGQPGALEVSNPRVLAASPAYWETVGASLEQGRFFDSALRDEQVAVIGKGIADQLGIQVVSEAPVIFVDGRPFTVIGIVENATGSSAPLAAVSVPDGVARSIYGLPGPQSRMTINTEQGAVGVVADQVGLAIDPSHPEAFKVVLPPPPTVVRDRVGSSTQSLFFALAAIGVLVGAVGIANSSLISVMSRIPEIGLRRSLGALPRHVAAQFLMEAAIRGLIGGAIGANVGVIAVAIVALTQEWTAVIEPWSVVGGPIIGTILGLVAGLYPALKASRIEPVEAFRR